MRTLLLNPPSFRGFDGGAGSRWPATREVESYWYPVWLCYPAGMLEDSRVVDAPPQGLSIADTVELARDFEFLVLFTSTPGFAVDVQIAERMKDVNPKLRIAFVGPPVTVDPESTLRNAPAIDFLVRREFDYQVAGYARGKPIDQLAGVSYRRNGGIVHNPDAPYIEDLDGLPWVTRVYRRDLDIRRYNVPFLRHPFLSFYTSRGCPAQCSFCLWPQTHSGHRWRLRSSEDVAEEARYVQENFPEAREVFFDDDTFNYQRARTLDLCRHLKPLQLTWSCTSRVTTDEQTLRAMKDAGCRLLIVGYESGDPEVLRNSRKGATLEMAERFTANCKKLGLAIHGDFIIGLPGETRQSIRRTIEFAKRLNLETIQVSIAHPYPGTEFYGYVVKNGLLTIDSMTDEGGHQLPNIAYPGLDRGELVDWVERFYREYYSRPKVLWPILRKALTDSSERKRLIKAAREYLELHYRRKRFVREQRQRSAQPHRDAGAERP